MATMMKMKALLSKILNWLNGNGSVKTSSPIDVEGTTGHDIGFDIANTTNNNKIFVGIGATGTNRGIYDYAHGKWSLFENNSGEVYATTPSNALVPLFTQVINMTVTHSSFDVYGGYSFKLYRFGNVCWLVGALKNTGSWNSGTEATVATVPTGYRPPATIVALQQGSGNCHFLVQIYTDGRVTLSRYAGSGTANNWSYETVGQGSWLNINTTWILGGVVKLLKALQSLLCRKAVVV